MSHTNPNHLLLRCLAATYLNRFLENKNGKVAILVEEIIKTTKLPVDTMGENSEGDITRALLQSIEWVERTSADIHIAQLDLVDRVRAYTGFDTQYTELVRNSLVSTDDPTQIGLKINTITSELTYELNTRKIARIVATYNRKINFEQDHIDTDSFLHEMVQELSAVGQTSADQEKSGFGGRCDFDEEEDVEGVFDRAIELVSDVGVLKTGLQGLNRMLGVGGYRRGESFCYGALTHNYKSGILLDHCRWLPMYNVPHMMNPEKKPLILRISFENKLEQDIPTLYKILWEQKHKKKLNIKSINSKEAAKFIREELGVNGYKFVIESYDPNNFDVWDIIDILNRWESKGYEIHAVVIDYLELVTKNAAKKTRQDQAINDAFEITRNHCFRRGITQIHAHQLSTEAQKIAREGSSATFVKRISTGSYWMNSQSLSTKFDGECGLHIHKVGEQSWLTFGRGKHRGGEDTPMAHRFFAYEMHAIGTLHDDLNSECKAIYNLSSVAGTGNDGSSTLESDGDW